MSSEAVGKGVLKIQDEVVMTADYAKLEPRVLAASPALAAPYGQKQKKRRLKKDCPCPKCQVWRQHRTTTSSVSVRMSFVPPPGAYSLEDMVNSLRMKLEGRIIGTPPDASSEGVMIGSDE